MNSKTCSKCGAVIEESQLFCGKCGQKVDTEMSDAVQSAIDSYNSNLESKNKKKWKFPIIISLIVLVIGLIIFVLFELSINGWSFDQFENVLSGSHYACLKKHNFIDATCEHGEYCEECGYEISGKIDHVWKAATCTSPKTCEVCKEKEGKALGHSTRIGYCSVCREYSSELSGELSDIKSYISDATLNLGYAADMILEANDSYYFKSTYISLAQDYLSDAKKSIQKAINSCGSYSEFSAIKRNLNSAYDEINTYSSYLSTLADGLIDASDYIDKANELIKDISR